MRNILLAVVAVFLFHNIDAQSCNPYFSIQEGIKSTYELYNAKNKLISKNINEFKNVSGSGSQLNATLLSQVVDLKKGTITGSSESDWTCSDGIVRFTMNAMTIEGIDMNASGIEVDVEGDLMDIPSSLQIGQTLEDVKYRVTLTVSGMNMMDRTFQIKNRKVESKENVTTPAGTFSCFKVSYVTESTGKSGAVSKPIQTSIWYSNAAGMVKTEHYKEGKVSSSQLLTKIEK